MGVEKEGAGGVEVMGAVDWMERLQVDRPAVCVADLLLIAQIQNN